MYNNLLRKITSLSLLSILLLSSAAFALPNAMPAAHAQVASHPNLFVSAENSQYNNYFAGPQVIQVIVSDPNINRLDQAYGEPIVTVSGKRLRMAQGTDGNWYGYFADRNQAELAGKTAPVAGQGLNFGYFCNEQSSVGGIETGLSFTDTKGFTIARQPFGTNYSSTTAYSAVGSQPASPFLSGFPNPGSLSNICTLSTASLTTPVQGATTEHVIRENKTLNTNPSGFHASAGLVAAWPIIQLYDFSGIPQSVVVDYSAAGGDQIVNLTFDRIPSNLITVTADRTAYPESGAVLLTMNDPQLNVDPTEDDIWTWGANPSNNTLFYQAWDRNGVPQADSAVATGTGASGNTMLGENAGTVTAMQNLIGNLTNFNFNHNGAFTFTAKAQSNRVVDFQTFGRDQLVCTTQDTTFTNIEAAGCDTATKGDPNQVTDKGGHLSPGSEMITFAEQGGVNTGVFGDWDGSRTPAIVMLNPSEESGFGTYPAQGSIRGQSATFKYNELSGSIVGGFAFGSITMTATNGTWPSGTRIPVTLTDMDENKNSKLTEFLNFYNPLVDRISAMKIGTPFSLDSANPSATPEVAGLTSTQVTLPTIHSSGIFNVGSLTGVNNATAANIAVDEQYSSRPVFQFTNQTTTVLSITNGSMLVIDPKTTMQTLLNTINNPVGAASTNKFKGFDFFNYDLRSFSSLNSASGNQITGVNIYLVNSTGPINQNSVTATGGSPGAPVCPTGSLNTCHDVLGTTKPVTLISLANNTSLQGFLNLNGTQTAPGGNASTTSIVNKNGIGGNLQVLKNIFSVNATNNIGIAFQFLTSSNTVPTELSANGEPVAADFFSVGILGDGTNNNQRINNAIYRWELQETGDNTGVFTGTTQFTMLNQLSIFDPATYANLRTINHDVLFVAIQDMLQSEARAPQITYLDLGADGVNTQVSAQQDIPTHSGTVSFDQKTYKVGDTVTITVNDPDLNTNNDLVVIYTAVKPLLAITTGNTPGNSPAQDPATDTIGLAGLGTYSDGTAIGRLLDVQFGQADIRWSNANIPNINTNTNACFSGTDSNTATPQAFASSLSASGFSLVETAAGSGIFTGTFEVPDKVCQNSVPVTTNGLNIKVNYVDFRDESGKLVEISDNAGIRGNTGSIKLDKAVYPVPFGTISTSAFGANFDTTNTPGLTSSSTTSLPGVFPLHRDLSGQGLVQTINGNPTVMALPAGNVIVHARVNDPDYTLAASGTNFIATGVWFSNSTIKHGPVAFQISRQGESVLLATAGGPAVLHGKIVDLGTTQLPPVNDPVWSQVPDLGPMTEISPGAGIFQADLPIELTDGPATSATAQCPTVTNYDGGINGGTFAAGAKTRFTIPLSTSVAPGPTGGLASQYCVRQGDVLTVTYFDTSDASGQNQTVTDSATFDLRNGVLQSDKSVYIIGSDMILTLVEPDFNLDSQTAETVPLDLIEWDSHAYKGTMGPLADNTVKGAFEAFDAKPSTFVETGKDTGIFQSVIKIPEQLGSTLLERGEQINLEYTDWGPAGAKSVGQNSQDIELTIYTSNFGATVELDQKVYTWTDMVYITVVAPDHNFDPNLIDTIGLTSEDQVIVSTRGNQIYYKLSETGVDTGIFTGYVILTGDNTLKGTGGVDGSGTEPTMQIGTGQTGSCNQSAPCGPTDGFLPAEDSDGVSVSFEFTRDQTVTGSALIRWNIGEVSWLQASYPANGQGVLQIVDPDMNLNPKAVDKFDTNVWSDSDSGGIKLTMTETGQDTGIFQGTVYFTTNFQSSGNRLHVSQGDTVTGEYDDRTLPPPYTTADDLRMTATTFIGTVVPPLERAPASNPRIVDSFGNAINGTVKTGQQIQVTADLANGQNTDQPFAYLVQIQDSSGVTVSLSWITGTLTAGQSLNPAQSWTPSAAGTYTAQIFVWQSISNPNALSPPLSTTITVQ